MQTTKKNFHTHAYTLGEKRVPSSLPKKRYTCNGPSDTPSAGGIANAILPAHPLRHNQAGHPRVGIVEITHIHPIGPPRPRPVLIHLPLQHHLLPLPTRRAQRRHVQRTRRKTERREAPYPLPAADATRIQAMEERVALARPLLTRRHPPHGQVAQRATEHHPQFPHLRETPRRRTLRLRELFLLAVVGRTGAYPTVAQIIRDPFQAKGTLLQTSSQQVV